MQLNYLMIVGLKHYRNLHILLEMKILELQYMKIHSCISMLECQILVKLTQYGIYVTLLHLETIKL
nr:MAG TPA: hypothetical protein [Crassvirales sp.]